MYHRYVMPEKDSLIKAEKIFKETYEKGIEDDEYVSLMEDAFRLGTDSAPAIW